MLEEESKFLLEIIPEPEISEEDLIGLLRQIEAEAMAEYLLVEYMLCFGG